MQIEKSLHRQLKNYCFHNDIMMRPFVEEIIRKAIKEKGTEVPNKSV